MMPFEEAGRLVANDLNDAIVADLKRVAQECGCPINDRYAAHLLRLLNEAAGLADL